MTPDTLLTAYAQRKDPEAFRDIVAFHQGPVYRTCRRILSAADAEDAAQQVFFKLVRNAENVRGDLGAWLHRCAVNTCLDLVRSGKRRMGHEAQCVRESSAYRTDSPEEVDDILAVVDECLLELAEPERELLVQYYLEGRSQQSLANQHEVHQTTIKRRLQNAVEKLRGTLRRRGITATAFLISTQLRSSSGAAIPASLSSSLGKLALANASRVPFPIPAFLSSVFSKPLIVTLVSLFALTGLVGSAATYFTSLGPSVTLRTLGSEAIFQQTHIADGQPPARLIDITLKALQSRGFEPVGNPFLIHDGGIGIESEATLTVGVPIEAIGANAQDENTVITSPSLMLCARGKPESDPYAIIEQILIEMRRRGGERTLRDRFIQFDPGRNAFAYEIQIGVNLP